MGNDMRQTGEDMVLWLLSATNHCREGCDDHFQISVANP